MSNPGVEIYMEESPNPHARKFVVNRFLVPQNKTLDFTSKEQAENFPLASIMFDFPFIRRVFVMQNFLAISKDENIEWYEIQHEIRETMREFLQNQQEAVQESNPPKTETIQQPVHENSEEGSQDEEDDNSDITLKIKSALDTYIKPAVARDGGAIVFSSYKNGVVHVLLQGACSGCPSASLTLKAGVENLLKNMIPQVKQVIANEN
ncbi:MAG: NifU family protein [Cytophagales bacterium]|nr:NifU family protein [Cytophagales bacterium]